MSRIATVFGATGLQGSSVMQALLKDGTFKPRAVTRNVDSEAAKKLAEQGAEVVAADLGDKQAMKKAVEGAECVFAVTFPYATTVSELVQGTNIVDASKEAGVQFVVFSTLPDAKEMSNGKYPHAAHMNDKAQVQKYLEASGLSNASIGTGGFLENTVRPLLGTPFEKTDTGYILNTLAKPHAIGIHTWITRDMGPAVLALFKQYKTRAEEINGQRFVLGVGQSTAEEYAKELAKGLGKPVELKYTEPRGIPPIDDMFDFTAEYRWYPDVPVLPDSRLERLGVQQGTVEEFARRVLKEHLEG
ncbi:NmrA-like family-domain-containing protein [Schizophyllum commune]